jgi:hypothetical protein
MSDVSERIIDEFSRNLARELEGGQLQTTPSVARVAEEAVPARGLPSAEDLQAKRPPVADAGRPSADALDLFGAAGAPVLRRLVPVVAGLILLALGVLVGRGARRRQGR